MLVSSIVLVGWERCQFFYQEVLEVQVPADTPHQIGQSFGRGIVAVPRCESPRRSNLPRPLWIVS